ncbi:hypothetical protein CZ787_00480 [Halomonas citrativorans]|uniref:Uncharacterized protein n=1 Tax=Halomonas citrativorans TaxID=2742612 RepID=A0A1R4HN89_9GAMM|nr:hypothetical protein CZ787_00480 [Halomonas citrativorans]
MASVYSASKLDTIYAKYPTNRKTPFPLGSGVFLWGVWHYLKWHIKVVKAAASGVSLTVKRSY